MGAQALEQVAAALAGVDGISVTLERPSNPEHGDYATSAPLQAARSLRRPPMEIARDLLRVAEHLPAVERASVAPPGFLNLEMATGWYAGAVSEILASGRDYGSSSAKARERVQVELVSANPTGPLTVGSGRNAAYGDAVARLLAFAGHEIEREYYFNDAGRQIELFRASVEARRRGEEPPEEGYVGEYVDELARADADPVALTMEAIRGSLARFGVTVDSWVRETDLEPSIGDVVRRLDTYEADGALWLRASAYGDEKDRVLVRSDGRPTYLAKDAVYVGHKFERGFDRAIYVLGADHHGYVGRLKALAAMLGHDPERLEVLLYQLVHLKEQGEQKRVSKRRGDVVSLDELMDKVGADAARWYLVSRSHEQTIEIDVDLARERTEKNPVYYVQYAHARIAGIVRNAGGAPASPEPRGGIAPEERDLVKRLVEFPGVVAEATERRGPHALPTYAIRLADDFHRFYHHHRVLGSDAQPFRLALCRGTQAVIARALDLVGVDAPERM